MAKLRGQSLEAWLWWQGPGNHPYLMWAKPTITHSIPCECGCGQKTEMLVTQGQPPNSWLLAVPNVADKFKLMAYVPKKILFFVTTED